MTAEQDLRRGTENLVINCTSFQGLRKKFKEARHTKTQPKPKRLSRISVKLSWKAAHRCSKGS